MVRKYGAHRSCHVKVNQHGYLAYRLFWDGRRSWEGTALRDTPRNRARVEARATIMTEEMDAGTFDYLRWFSNGNLAHVFRTAPAPAPEPPPAVTVQTYAEQTWLPRKVPPVVRASLADTYRSALRAHILPAVGEMSLADLKPTHLEDLRALMTRPVAKGGKGPGGCGLPGERDGEDAVTTRAGVRRPSPLLCRDQLWVLKTACWGEILDVSALGRRLREP